MGKVKSHEPTQSSVGTTSHSRRASRHRVPAGIIAPLSPPIRQPSIRQSAIRDSHRTKLVRYAVESVGSRVTGDPVRRGQNALIPCDADATVEDLLRRRLMATSIGHKMHRHGDRLLWIEFRDKSGAPRHSLPKDRVLKIGVCVQQMHDELGVLKKHMGDEKFLDARIAAGREELRSLLRRQFQELRSRYKHFQALIAIETHPELQAKLMERLPESRQFVLLAKEFTAAFTGEQLAVVKEAWFQFPGSSKTPKIRAN